MAASIQQESVRTLRFPCRLGELTLWNPHRRLWVYHAGLWDDVPESVLVHRFQQQQGEASGALLYGVHVSGGERRLRWESGLLRYLPQSADRYLIDLTSSLDDYMARFGAKSRSTLRRKVRRFEREGGPDACFREYRGAEALDEFLPLACEVSSRSYQEIMLDAGMPDDASFQSHMRAAGEEDRARGYLLFYQGTPVAYLYCPITDGVARYEFVGYDQAHRGLSPGTVLLMYVLESLFKDPGVHTFDFTEGGGEASHKAFFATDAFRCGNVYLMRPTPGNTLIIMAQLVSSSLSEAASRLLTRLGLKAWVKRVLRRLRRAS